MAHIAIVCPHCQSRYQVEPDLRGRAMRCPNPVCREVFEVKEEGTVSAPAAEASPKPRDVSKPTTSQVSGSVGDIVPMLTGEAVDETRETRDEGREFSSDVLDQVPLVSAEEVSKPLKPPRASPQWDKIPPPVRQKQGPTEKPSPRTVPDQPAEPTESDDDDFLDKLPSEWEGARDEGPEARDEKPDGTKEVEKGVRELAAGTWEAPPVRNQQSGVSVQDSPLTTHHSPLTTPHATRRRVRRIILLLLVILSGGVAWGFWYARGSRSESETVLFQKAEALYKDNNFAEAVTLLQALNRDFPDSKKRNLYRFLAELSDVREPVYNAPDGSEEPLKALDRLAQFLKVYHKDALLTPYEGDVWQTLFKLSRELTDQAAQKKDLLILDRARQALDLAGTMKAPAIANALERTREEREKIAQSESRIIEGERRQALIDRIKKLKPSTQAVQEARRLTQAGKLNDDPEMQKLLGKLIEEHAGAVTYTAVNAPATKPAPSDTEPSILVAPRMGTATEPVELLDQRPVFALVRGVLYALEPRNGDILWARRVGADTTLLPLRLPATPISPEIALVLASDSKTVSALEVPTGRTVWEHQLEDACLGQPVLAGNRLLIPTYSGKLDEIDVHAGRLLGYYQLGQPLTVGGALDARTGLAYFPADNFCVYVLDVARRKCVGVLYSGHPSGSLRSAPVVLGDGSGPSKGLLILPQAQGLDAMLLRAFELPIRHPDQPALTPELKIGGWTWFPPYHDGERLALATDKGVFALFGLRQKGNRDPLLFPMLKEEVVLGGEGFGRAQIVHADADNFWVLSRGRLHRLQLTFSPKTGPGILERWPKSPTLGSPLHAAQVRSRQDGNVLFLVTRIPAGQSSLASAVDGKSGEILWQRQLGVEVRGQPLVIGGNVFARDPAGIFHFDPVKTKDRVWQQNGSLILPSSAQAKTFLLPSDKGVTLLNLTGLNLQVGQYHAGQDKLIAKTHELPAALAGTPGHGPDCLVLPLANGVLARLPLGDGALVPGPNWRAAGVEEDGDGHVLALPGNDYVVTDGGRGLQLLHWAEPKVWDKKKSVQLTRRIVAPPVLVAGKDKNRIAVADAADTLTLLDADTLAVVRTWTMPGPITSGPFAQGNGIGCVVGKNRLVWMNPEKETPLWEYTMVAEIVGVPQLVDGVLVVANLAGQFMGLDPSNGRPRGSGYTLKANVAPTAAPVPFGPERLFAPLTDGTIMLLDRKHFR